MKTELLESKRKHSPSKATSGLTHVPFETTSMKSGLLHAPASIGHRCFGISVCGIQGLLLEFNHDLELLQNGPYPEALKRRVGGEWGHLNNSQAAEFLAGAVGCDLQQLAVAHISDKNNDRQCVEMAMKAAGSWREDLTWACQEQGFDWLNLV